MGVDYHAHVTFGRLGIQPLQILPVAPIDVVRAFVEYGWSIDNGLSVVQYTVSGRDTNLELFARPVGEWVDALAEIDRASSQGGNVSLTLTWPGTEFGGTLSFEAPPSAGPGSLAFSADRERRKLLPELERLVDYNWYTIRIVQPLDRIGAEVLEFYWI